MSAALGPKIFALPGAELVAMMEANFESLKKVVDDIDNAIAVEEEKNTAASLKRWRDKFAQDAVHTHILLSHVRAQEEHLMTGTEIVAVFNTFKLVSVHIPFLRFNPPPPDGEMAEIRLAATAAAIPRAAGNAQGVSRLWTPGVSEGIVNP